MFLNYFVHIIPNFECGLNLLYMWLPHVNFSVNILET